MKEFFNVGEDRYVLIVYLAVSRARPDDIGSYPFWTVLLPLRIEPANDGWRWRKRQDWQLGSIEEDDMLTDEEGD